MITLINKETREESELLINMKIIAENMKLDLSALDTKPGIIFNDEMIKEIRQLIKSDEKRLAFVEKISSLSAKTMHKEFLDNPILDTKIAMVLNNNSFAGNMLESIVISRLSYKLPIYESVNHRFEEYYKDEAKLSFGKTILNALVALGHIKRTTNVTRKVIEGNVKFFNEVYYDFKGEEKTKDLIAGLHLEPGKIDDLYVHTKPGAKKVKISSSQKRYLKRLSSIPLRLVRTDADKLASYYKQTEWYKNALSKKIEDPILLHRRITRYVNAIQMLQTVDRLYLTNWFDSRLRMYYGLTMPGINPQGDSFETHMWESSEARLINEQGYEDLVWAAVVIARGRRNKPQSLKYWGNHEKAIREELVDEDNNSFGEAFYNGRLLDAIDDYRNGRESRFLLGFDYTTGGLQHFGTAFRSVKSMKASNMGGLKTVRDAHGELGETFGLDREIAKDINTPLLHGSTYKTIAKVISEATSEEISPTEAREHIIKTYGKEIENIQTIASWGTVAHDTKNPSLTFLSPDGEKAQSTCYFKSVELVVYGLEFVENKMYSQCTVHRDMPYVESANAEPVHDSPKIRGFYANATHTFDGYVLRQMDAEIYKHDKFYTHPNDMEPIREQGRKAAIVGFRSNFYLSAMKDVAKTYVGSATLPIPELMYGDATEKMILDSDNFLMP